MDPDTTGVTVRTEQPEVTVDAPTVAGDGADGADRPDGRARALAVVTSRRLRDAVLVAVVVASAFVTRQDMPLFERLAHERLGGDVDYVSVTVTTAWLTATVLLLVGMLLAALLAGAGVALVHRIAARATKDEVRPLRTVIGTAVAGYFLVRIGLVALREPTAGTDEVVAFSALDVDLGLVLVVALVATLVRWVTRATWGRSAAVALVAAAVIAVFVNWKSVA